jgi:hypothetical protein
MVNWLRKPFGSKKDKDNSNVPFNKDIGKKILALVIAVSLWLVANLQHDVEKNVKVSINYSNIPQGLIIVNNPPKNLNIRVRGPRSQLSTISAKDMLFTIDLSNVTTGTSLFEIRTDQIIPPRDVLVTGISPSEVTLDIDKLKQKNVTINPSIGPPDTGFEVVGKPTVTPGRVTISGPESLLSKINSVSTDPVSLSGEKSKFTIEVPVRSPYPLVDIVGHNTVKVTVDIKETILEKEFNDLDISLVNFDDLNFETQDRLVADLAFEGPFSIINNLNSQDIELYVDGSDIKGAGDSKTHNLKVSVSYPHKDVLKLTKQSPKTIAVKLN